MEPNTYRVLARNLAKTSENKMHDDTVARRFGFSGGLVPGVDVFAYMSHMPLERWGRAFLEIGNMDARFLKPVYDGETAEVLAQENDGGLDLTIMCRGGVCGTGRAFLQTAPPSFRLDEFETVAPRSPRLPVGPKSYALDTWLGILPFTQGSEPLDEYLRGIGETVQVFADERIVHPGTLLRTLNWALMENAILGPWIHVGSTVQNLGIASATDELTVRAKVVGNYERKGHRFVELDGVVVANGSRLIAHCRHVAIIEPRVAAAA